MEILVKKMEKFVDSIPCSRVINGFRLFPTFSDECGIFYWTIVPNCSPRTFAFTKLSLAEDFAKNYHNCHSDAFWLKLWTANPLFSCLNVEKVLNSSIDYLL